MMNRVETRFAYGDALAELGGQNPRVVVLDADLYNSTRSSVFRARFPERFIDLGIAEQDMVSVAAGMAASGLIPFCNSFAIFITGRAYDQIRLQLCYADLPVRLVGSSAGLTLGADGASHQSLEDISLMRSLPKMTVIVPADDLETQQATMALADYPGPAYLRLGRYPVPRLHSDDYQFEVGKITRLRDGMDVTVFATGHMVWKAMEAADLLHQAGVDARVVNVSTIKPLDSKAILSEVTGMQAAFSVEEHSILGGLGSAVAEVLAENMTAPLFFRRLGVRDRFGESALADELLELHRLQPGLICEDITRALTEWARPGNRKAPV
jgi:transketolase